VTDRLLTLAQLIVQANNTFSDVLGVLIGLILFGCLAIAMQRSRKAAKAHELL
jgi:hypothetical protein